MKIHCTVVFLVLSAAWFCHAKPTVEPEVWETDSPSTELEVEEGLKELPLSDEEIEDNLTQDLDTQNEVELTTQPTKRRSRPQALAGGPVPYYQPYNLAQVPVSAMPYSGGLAPMPYAMPYSQCPYSQQPVPLYYPQPMYPAYPYPSYNPVQFAEQASPNRILQDSADTTKVEINEINELLKFRKLNNKRIGETTTTVEPPTKPTKRIGNWIRNKWNRKAQKNG